MSLVWVVEARREEGLLLVQQISSSWQAVMRRQIMTERLAQMLSLNLIRRPLKSARCHSLSTDASAVSQHELCACCFSCSSLHDTRHPLHMCADQYCQKIGSHAELLMKVA